MKRLHAAAIAVPRFLAGLFLLCFAVCSMAQLTTPTAPSGSLTMAGTPIAAGTASFTVVNQLGSPVAVQSGGVVYAPQSIACAITSGAITGTCSVPDLGVAVALTPNTVLAYTITVTRTSDSRSYTLQQVTGVTGSTWALNTWAPLQTAVVSISGLATGSTVPTSCHGASLFYTQTTPTVHYSCVGNVYVQQASGSGSGTGINWRSAYAGGTAYAAYDAVSYGGSSYLSLQASNTGHEPDTSGSWWGLLAAAGAPGTNGSNGATGATGATGPAPTITVGTVTALAAGAQPTVTITGSGGAYTINLGIPAGATGAAGSTGNTGATGAAGATGATGPAPTLTIGTVTTGTAAATITGSGGAYTLNLTLPSAGGSNITLKTNGTNNGSQTVLNLKPGSGITITDDGSGGITITAAVTSVAGKTGTVTLGPSDVGADASGAAATVQSNLAAEATARANADAVLQPMGIDSTFASLPTLTAAMANAHQLIILTDSVPGSGCSAGGGTGRAACEVYTVSAGVYGLRQIALPFGEKGVANGVATLDTNALVPAVQMPAATSTTQGAVLEADGAWTNKLGSLALNLQPNARIWTYGTSYYGVGSTDPETGVANSNIGGLSAVIARDTPGTFYPNWISGSLVSADSVQMGNTFFPDQTYPSSVFIEGGENETASTSGTYLQNLFMYEMSWPSTPYAYRIAASAATAAGGSFSTYGTFPVQPGLLAGSNGSGRSVSGTSGTLTFAIPSSNTGTKARVHYPCLTSSGGTFRLTNTTTSTSYVDNISGTTTYSNVCPTGGTQYAISTQEVTIPVGASNIVFAPASGNAGTAIVYAIDFNPPAFNTTTGTLGVSNQTTVWASTVNTTYAPTSATAVNTAIQAAFTALGAAGDGLPVFLTDINSNESAGNMSARAWNNSLDTATVATGTCPASQVSGHPNDCWVEIWWKHYQIAQRNNHYLISYTNLGGRATRRDATFDTTPSANLPGSFIDALSWKLNNNANTFGNGFESYIYGNTRAGYSYGTNTTSGLPFSNVKVHRLWDNTGGGGICASSVSVTITSTTSYADSLFTDNWCANGHTGMTWQTGPALAPIFAASMGTAIASAATIAPTTGVVHITGAAAISTITPPTGCTTIGFSCSITLIPDGAFTTITGGNIASASAAVVNRPLVMTRDITYGLWYPSY